jgi:diketogulonate reductase-like aldo/keto reductase
MRSVILPGSGRQTTQLGFGCAYVSPDNSRVLDAAYDAGVRHFDVARSYGRGLTEGILGRFLKRCSEQVTVTSKYGITPPFSHPLHALARAVLKPALKRLRRASIINRRLDLQSIIQNRKGAFSADDARRSLELSLRNLKLDTIDVFLMHDADADDLVDPGLLQVLNDAVLAGQVGAFGVGGPSDHLGRLRTERLAFCRILQYEWTPLDPVVSWANSFPILYRVFGGPVGILRETLLAERALRRQWSDEIDQDLSIPGTLERLMLNAALELRREGLVLFSTTQPERVLQNVRMATDPRLTSAAMRLATMARAWHVSRHSYPDARGQR